MKIQFDTNTRILTLDNEEYLLRSGKLDDTCNRCAFNSVCINEKNEIQSIARALCEGIEESYFEESYFIKVKDTTLMSKAQIAEKLGIKEEKLIITDYE